MEKIVYKEIFSTKDYDSFNNIKGNRLLRQCNLNKIIQSMKEKQLVIPICVNDKMEIIDGQHRFESCKTLGLPVYFYIEEGYNIEDVERANRANSNWLLSDFLASYSSKGNPVYTQLADIVEEYGISVAETLKIIAKFDKSNILEISESFKNESLSISDDAIFRTLEFLDSLRMFQDFAEYKNSRFISAYLMLYCHKKYNHEMMVSKYKSLKRKLVKCSTIEDYLAILANQIYSARKVSKNNIYYNKEQKHLYS